MSRKSIVLLLAVLFAALPAFAQDGRPKGYANASVTEEAGVITVCYDLLLNHAARVTLVASAEGNALVIRSLTGDAGIVLGPKSGLCMRWNTLADYPEGLSGYDISLDINVEEYDPPAGSQEDASASLRKSATQEEIVGCINEKHATGYKSDKDEITRTRGEYTAFLSNDQAVWVQMMQKLKGGIPFVKRWERDREGRQVPVYQYEDISDRERSKLQRELDKQLEKAEKNLNSVISAETRRSKDKFETSVNRLFKRIAGACEQDLGVPAENLVEWVTKVLGPNYLMPEPFSFIRRERDWE